MSRVMWRAVLAAGLVVWSAQEVMSQCQFRGMIDDEPGYTYCQATHRIVDPCASYLHYVDLRSSAHDLNLYKCQSLSVQGTSYADVECPTCLDLIDVQTLTPEPPACVIQVQSFKLVGGASTQLSWQWLPCAGRYDIIRGDVSSLRQTGPSVDLGTVVCLKNDVPQVPYPQDPTVPAIGHAFFYLVRAQGAIGTTPYGISSAGAEEIPSAGDCPR